MLDKDSGYFLELQTKTGWGKTLFNFAEWCAPGRGWACLDVGCGPGLFPAILAEMGCLAVGVDLDPQMFKPTPLHARVVLGDVAFLPFVPRCFDLVTAVNLLFLLDEPEIALRKMSQLLRPGGKLAMLNPSELIDEDAASNFAIERGLEGLARDTLVNWAKRATVHHRWTENSTAMLYHQAGLKLMGTDLRIGPGFARFSWGTH
jgi:SAM-dependent methyltransferase